MANKSNSNIDNLKADIDKLGTVLRVAEKEIYERINTTDKNVNELNTASKLLLEKLSAFLETFEKHDSNEMQKYDDILKMFEKTQKQKRKLEKTFGSKYATKRDIEEINIKLNENNEGMKKGFKIFYIGTGIFMAIVGAGGLIMWILNLISELQKLGVN